MTLAAGARLNHYQILAPLGAGGMGEVYLAEDTRLRRKVALKLLPAEVTRDAERLRRFAQEARAASALNHPNILTIFEVGEVDGAHFIATEFIDGQTLRERLKSGPPALPAALDLAIQIAAALAAAHEAGIVHRDIKPENVMVRRDIIVKVLDFGLAKLSEAVPVAAESEAPTIAKVDTDPGTVLGTASYMSPEQARGQEVDARSDTFSLGLVLYEMIAGRTPFTGVNAIEVMGAILNQEPAPLRQHTPEAPAELQRIVNKALRKDREQRYQHVKDLLLDLKDLKQELEFEAKLKGAQPFAAPRLDGSPKTRETPAESSDTKAQPDAATNGVAAAHTTSSAEIILGEIKRHKAGVMIGIAVMIACVGLMAYGVYWVASPKQTAARFQNVKLTRLTSVGNVGFNVSVSPDGKFIAYVQREGGKNSLWTKAVATGSAVQIVQPTEAELSFDTTFSLDGNYVYYRQREGQTILYQIPVLGGTAKKVLTEIDSLITFSPEGKQFAFTRRRDDQTKSQLIIVDADGGGERILAERPLREAFRTSSWSPDGKIIAAIASSVEGAIRKPVLFGIAVESGEVQPLVQLKHGFRTLNNLKWLKDGKGLVMTATEREASSIYQIWHVSYPGGEVRRITNDLANYPSLSLTADNSALIANQVMSYSNLWITPLGASGRAQQITRGDNRDGSVGLRWVTGGRVVYTSAASGNLDLWLINADGSNARQLTNDEAFDYSPAVTPDGRHVVFASQRSGRLNLWRTDLDGRNPKQLTTGETNSWFDLSPDGRWVIFTSQESGSIKLYKVSLEGGSPVHLREGSFSRPAVSPDGKLIACLSSTPQSSQPKVVILPLEGSTPVKTIESKYVIDNNATGPLRWTPDGRALIYVDARQGGANLWRMPLDSSPPQPVTHFDDVRPEKIWSFDLSRDGKQLVIARGSQNADVVMFTEIK
jgi:serine/threonine protein kinase/Tol biopolymer transport system component